MQEDRVNSPRIPSLFLTIIAITAFGAVGPTGFAQTGQSAGSSSANQGEILDLQDQVRQLRVLVEEMRTENAQSRSEMHQLRQDLEATRALLEHPPATSVSRSEEHTSELQSPCNLV